MTYIRQVRSLNLISSVSVKIRFISAMRSTVLDSDSHQTHSQGGAGVQCTHHKSGCIH